MRRTALAVASFLLGTSVVALPQLLRHEALPLSKDAVKAVALLGANCQDGVDEACEQLKIVERARTGDIAGAIDQLASKASESVRFEAECHQGAHIIGKLALHSLGINEVMTSLPGICRAGIIHGAQEEWATVSSLGEIIEGAPALCSGLDRGHAYDTCVHGIGHTFLYELDDWVLASKLCAKTLPVRESYDCISGAVMSYSDIAQTEGELQDRTSLSDQLQKCLSLAGEGPGVCAHALGIAVFRGLGFDGVASFTVCGTTGNTLVAEKCNFGVGNEVAYRDAGDPARIQEICRQSDLIDPCAAGAAFWTATNLHDLDSASSLCTPHRDEPYCSRTLQEMQAASESLQNLEGSRPLSREQR